jgi:putative ABC transport system permease protein
MSLWRQLTRGLRVLTNRAAADRDVADEVRDYLDRATRDLTAGGMEPDEARRMARLEFGDRAAIAEQVRAYGWENLVGTSVADLRYAARRLRLNPGFTAAVVATLALGLGASTAIFSAVRPVLFDSLPYPAADRLVTVWYAGADGSRVEQAFGTFRELATRSRSFDGTAVMKPWQPTLTGPTEPERLIGQRVSAGYFAVLGVRPALGRGFQSSDDRVAGPRVVVLGDALWRRRFGADRAILGHEVTLDEEACTVVGVMPPAFENVLAPSVEIWSPLQYDASLPSLEGREWGHHLRMVARLRSGIGRDQAASELARIARAPVREFPRPPWAAMRQGSVLTSLQDDVVGGVRAALLAVLGAVVLVLLIGAVNVTNLLLDRGAQRRGELAVRTALGAGRVRLVRQLTAESLLLAAVGGALGFAVARLGVPALVTLAPSAMPRASAIRVDGGVFASALAVSLLLGLAVGLLPALAASAGDLAPALQQASRWAASGRHWARRSLVVAEVALALVLLVGAGLLLRSVGRLFGVAPGFEPSHVLTVQVQTAGHRFREDGATIRFFDSALDAVRRVPGVESAAYSSQLPLSGDHDVYGVRFAASPGDQPSEGHGVFRYAVSAGYFGALRIPLRRGRLPDGRDVPGAPVAVAISEALATRAFPNQDPIGRRLHLGRTDLPWYTIVGVVGDVKQALLGVGSPDAVYVPASQWYAPDSAMWFVVRSHGDAASLAPAVRNAVWSVDKDQPVVRVSTMDDLLAGAAAERRFALVVFEAFGLVALALAAVGIYGVLSGGVTERTREIGVRSALGASRASIVSLVVREGMAVAGLGVAAGVVAAVAASRTLATLLFGVSPLDPLTYAGVGALLLAVGAVACWMPAWRASRIDPSVTLRAE